MKFRILTLRALIGVLLAAAAMILVLARIPAAGSQPGTIELLGVFPASDNDVCTVRTDNNESVHVGNVMLIQTGLLILEVPAVEDEPNTITVTEVVARGDIKVSVRKAGNITSLEVSVGCVPQEPPVTVTSPPTTLPPPVTTEPPPPIITTTTTVIVDDCETLGIPCETTTTAPPPPTTSLPPTPVDPPTPGTPQYTG